MKPVFAALRRSPKLAPLGSFTSLFPFDSSSYFQAWIPPPRCCVLPLWPQLPWHRPAWPITAPQTPSSFPPEPAREGEKHQAAAASVVLTCQIWGSAQREVIECPSPAGPERQAGCPFVSWVYFNELGQLEGNCISINREIRTDFRAQAVGLPLYTRCQPFSAPQHPERQKNPPPAPAPQQHRQAQ